MRSGKGQTMPHRPARPPAMSDVAVAAGVSHQTVSRVLNDHPNVSEATRSRVLAAIEALGYRRNSAARALATRRSSTIGVVSTGSPLFGPASTLLATEAAAREAGYFVSLATITRHDRDAMREAFDHFLSQGVDGIIVVAPHDEVADAVVSLAAPVAAVLISSTQVRDAGTGAGLVRSVGVDQRAGARLATQHLLDLGHDDVVHLAGPSDWFDARERVAGWRATLDAAGVAWHEPLAGDWSAERGYDVGRRLVDEGLPSAIFAGNDQLALGLLHAFWDAGVRVPDDVSVVGFDDVAGSDHFLPPLTTVRQHFGRLGRRAIDVLTGLLDGQERDQVPLLPDLRVRASTAPPRSGRA